ELGVVRGAPEHSGIFNSLIHLEGVYQVLMFADMTTSERLLLLLFVVYIGTAAENESKETSCEDINPLCSGWKSKQGCVNDTSDCRFWESTCATSTYTRKECPKSCNACETGSEADSCTDYDRSCTTNWKCTDTGVPKSCPCTCKTCAAKNAVPGTPCEDDGHCSSSCGQDETRLFGYSSTNHSLKCCKQKDAVISIWKFYIAIGVIVCLVIVLVIVLAIFLQRKRNSSAAHQNETASDNEVFQANPPQNMDDNLYLEPLPRPRSDHVYEDFE
ncbi:unnamed protein product, partial [Meganyctiphanes norvegica]